VTDLGLFFRLLYSLLRQLNSHLHQQHRKSWESVSELRPAPRFGASSFPVRSLIWSWTSFRPTSRRSTTRTTQSPWRSNCSQNPMIPLLPLLLVVTPSSKAAMVEAVKVRTLVKLAQAKTLLELVIVMILVELAMPTTMILVLVQRMTLILGLLLATMTLLRMSPTLSYSLPEADRLALVLMLDQLHTAAAQAKVRGVHTHLHEGLQRVRSQDFHHCRYHCLLLTHLQWWRHLHWRSSPFPVLIPDPPVNLSLTMIHRWTSIFQTWMQTKRRCSIWLRCRSSHSIICVHCPSRFWWHAHSVSEHSPPMEH
jgi:hypothetical protein